VPERWHLQRRHVAAGPHLPGDHFKQLHFRRKRFGQIFILT
jgi:hypothetical protein